MHLDHAPTRIFDPFDEKRFVGILPHLERPVHTRPGGSSARRLHPGEVSGDERRHAALMDLLDTGNLFTVFQPMFNLHNGECFALEALTRIAGDSPFSGPEELFQTARAWGELEGLEHLCRRKAITGARQRGIGPYLALNICPSLLHMPLQEEEPNAELLAELFDIRHNVILELTERYLISDHKTFGRVVSHFKGEGLKIAVDDLGAGFAGLKMLSELEPFLVKIDRFMISGIARSPKKRMLLESLVSFCHKMGSMVVAEGLETEEELKAVLAMNVDLGQGYLLARPAEHPEACSEVGMRCILEAGKRGAWPSERFHGIGALAIDVEPLDVSAKTETIVKRFRDDNALTAIPVLDGRIPAGIVHKTKLFYKLGQQYGYSLYSQKTARRIMDPVLIFEETSLLDEVSSRILDREENSIYDAVILTRGGHYSGIVKVHHIYQMMTELKILMATQANPLTGLPGNNMIEEEIESRLCTGQVFSVLYLDLDHFKPFNDHYGFEKGDRVLRFVGDLLKECAKEWDLRAFIGHIGGDDFVLACRWQNIEHLCERILSRFDEEARRFHDEAAVRAGFYEGVDREGHQRRFPLLSLSIGAVHNVHRVIRSYSEIVSIASELKKKAKSIPGSSYCVDRRRE